MKPRFTRNDWILFASVAVLTALTTELAVYGWPSYAAGVQFAMAMIVGHLHGRRNA